MVILSRATVGGASYGVGMPKSREDQFRALLAEQREEALRALAAAQASLAMVAEARDQAGGDDEHDPEGVPLSREWARVDAAATGARARLDEVDAASLRLENGTYGVCRSCVGAIPIERLRIRPYADVCVPCGSRSRR